MFHEHRASCLSSKAVPVPRYCTSVLGRFAQAIDAFDQDGIAETCANILVKKALLLEVSRDFTPALIAELPSLFEEATVDVTPGAELPTLMARSSEWPFWLVSLNDVDLVRNIRNLLHADYRRGLVPAITAECARIRPELSSLYMTEARLALVNLCAHPKGVSLVQAVAVLNDEILAEIDCGDSDEIIHVVREAFGGTKLVRIFTPMKS